MSDYFVYVLRNEEGRHYIGLSEDPGRRLLQHNAGLSKWTRPNRPWDMVWQKGPYLWAKRANWRASPSARAAGRASIPSQGYPALMAHHPAAAGPRVQIPPPQPNAVAFELPRAFALSCRGNHQPTLERFSSARRAGLIPGSSSAGIRRSCRRLSDCRGMRNILSS